MTEERCTVIERSNPGADLAIEDALQLLDNLRGDLRVALANNKTDLAMSLLEEIELAAATLDDLVNEKHGEVEQVRAEPKCNV
ncbi:MAG: hypothetical protein JXQ99_25635 [Hyphomicrobiaceae bacterium]